MCNLLSFLLRHQWFVLKESNLFSSASIQNELETQNIYLDLLQMILAVNEH